MDILIYLMIANSMSALCESSKTLICSPSTIKSKLFMNESWMFGETLGDTWAKSKEVCENSTYTASVECQVTQNSDGPEAAYYNPSTLRETPCTQSYEKIMHQLDTHEQTTESVDNMISSLDAMFSTYSRKSADLELQDTVAAVIKLSRMVHEQQIQITESSMVHLFWMADNLHDALQNEGVGKLSNREKTDFIDALDIFADNILLNQKAGVRLTAGSAVFEAKILDRTSNQGVTFFGGAGISRISSTPVLSSAMARIPSSALPTNDGIATEVASFYFHQDGILFPEPEDSDIKVEQALSVQISHAQLINMKEPIAHSFHRKSNNTMQKSGKCSIRYERCGYLSIPEGTWKYSGCTTNVTAARGSTVCYCNHATNFAVLVQTQEVKSSFALDIAGNIGCACSVVGLSLLLAIYLSFSSLRTRKLNQIHMHLSVCLLVGYIAFLAGAERPRAYLSCIAVGAIIQFAFLCAWGWMLVEFVGMYKKLIQVFSNISGGFVIKSAVIVYGLSLLTTVITLVSASVGGDFMMHREWHLSPDNDPLCWKSYYVSDRLCWLHSYSLFFGFLTPIGAMFIVNFIGFILVLKATAQSTIEIGQTRRKLLEPKDHAFRIFSLSILLGVTWVFAIPLALSDDQSTNEVFSWLFSLSNAFQGMFIFMLYCVRREDVRIIWTTAILRAFRRKEESEREILETPSQKTQSGEKGFSNPAFNAVQEWKSHCSSQESEL